MPPDSPHFVYAFDPPSRKWSIRFDDYEPLKDGEESVWYAESPEEALRNIEQRIQLLQRKTIDNLAWQREKLCRIAEEMRTICTNPKYLSVAEAQARARYDWKNTPDEERVEVPWERTLRIGTDGSFTITGKG